MELDDAQLTQQLIGTWRGEHSGPSQITSVATYNADGTGSELLSWQNQPEPVTVQLSTRWSITDGILNLISVASSDPNRIPVGLALKDRIISISDGQLVFQACDGYGIGDGEQEVKVRVS